MKRLLAIIVFGILSLGAFGLAAHEGTPGEGAGCEALDNSPAPVECSQ